MYAFIVSTLNYMIFKDINADEMYSKFSDNRCSLVKLQKRTTIPTILE